MHAYGCSVGAKFQITLPKAVRAALHIEKKGEMVGFMVQGERVILAKARIEPEETFTQEEWDKLLRLAQEQPEKSFKSGKEFLQDFRKFAHSRKHL
ncbi:MAG: AbrB/MazE/SpoVT family DNA-binding domain-containing protein [Elusimicrobia bacterium]|nr:AbrB/MazE/SpoVT family DNA-binding domain-containing protein [Elusimicrobiota bacterium]